MNERPEPPCPECFGKGWIKCEPPKDGRLPYLDRYTCGECDGSGVAEPEPEPDRPA